MVCIHYSLCDTEGSFRIHTLYISLHKNTITKFCLMRNWQPWHFVYVTIKYDLMYARLLWLKSSGRCIRWDDCIASKSQGKFSTTLTFHSRSFLWYVTPFCLTRCVKDSYLTDPLQVLVGCRHKEHRNLLYA